jgi:hypothetical protein
MRSYREFILPAFPGSWIQINLVRPLCRHVLVAK